MADVIHKTTFELRRSVNTPDYPAADWLHVDRAEADRVQAIPVRFRKLDGGQVVAMGPAEQAAVEADRLPGIKRAKILALQDEAFRFIAQHYSAEAQQAALLLMQNARRAALANRQANLSPLFEFAETVVARVADAKDAVVAAVDADAVAAIELDLSGITIPTVDVAAQAKVHS